MSTLRKRLQLIGATLFIGANVLLVYTDDEEKVDRIAYVSEWADASQADLEKKLHTTGVLTSAEEKPIYFDSTTGSFEAFKVKEGDVVKAGDALFTYKVGHYQAVMAELLEKKMQLEEEIASIEKVISQMSSLQIPDINTESAGLEWTEEELTITIPQDPVQARLMKQQFLLEKETEVAEKQIALKSVDSQITELQETGDTITVDSPYEGTITQLSKQLTDPIITVSSTELHVEGELTESERVDVKTDLSANIEVTELKESLTGTVTKVGEMPKEKATATTSSLYPIIIKLNEFNEEQGEAVENDDEREDGQSEGNLSLQRHTEQNLLPGYHVDIDIITETSEGATVLMEDAIFQQHVWKMTEMGTLLRQKISTGLKEDSRVEIISDLQVGDKVALQPGKPFRSNASFITPLKWGAGLKPTVSPKGTNWLEFFISGIINR
ncbi:efflux RND transporter periplasmic adaptor subunit [Virgibacillus dokdonensis]|uniref:Efflux system component YknX n=1 Tax=Virgibacillus dokdonensis TaxID=302167 RepID=A0A2K9IWY9_9BACI|nr:HlyD family secretion protein [Virgibacillus dokdonensis]AUJ24262.1 Putative efflux system component YknX [Virgibacillus dokdonensis]